MLKKEISKEENHNYPLYSFNRKVIIAHEERQIDQALEMVSGYAIVGFDTESKPTYKKGEFNHVALLQLALPDVAFLLRIHKVGLTDSLIRFFEDDHIFKVGIAIDDDLAALKKRRFLISC